MKLLITSSRMGHVVHAADTFARAPGNHSTRAAIAHETVAPRRDAAGYRNQIEMIVDTHDVAGKEGGRMNLTSPLVVSLALWLATPPQTVTPDESFLSANTLSWEDGDVELSLTATALPWVVTAFAPDGALYRKARRELLGNYDDASRSGWGTCSHAGYECRIFYYEYADEYADARHGMARLYLPDDVLVVANATYAPGHRAEARSFLASVQ